MGVGSLLLLLALAAVGAYTGKRRSKPASASACIALMAGLMWIAVDHVMSTMAVARVASVAWLDAWLINSVFLMIGARIAWSGLIRRLDQARPHLRRVVAAGDARYVEQWLQAVRQPLDDYVITAAYVGDNVAAPAPRNVAAIGDFESLVLMARDQCFDELWLAIPIAKQAEIRRYVTALQHHFVDIRLRSDMQDIPFFNPSARTMAGTTFIDLVASPKHDNDAWPKPIFDRLFALAALLALSPLLLAIALAIKVNSRGPVLFRQKRKGADGRTFTILKFRSMRLHAEAEGTVT
jgi:FlaA1/EpsC-like NDP-sugar epimerase